MRWQGKKKNRRLVAARSSNRLRLTINTRWRNGVKFSLMMLVVTLSTWQAHDWLINKDSLVLKQVRVGGSFAHISRTEVQALLEPYAGKFFFDIDVVEITRVLQSQPWIMQASVRRQWPDGLEVMLQEQTPVARWGEQALLNEKAALFFPTGSLPENLPYFNGIAQSEALLLSQWQEMEVLLQPLGLKIVTIDMNERRSWRIKLDNGLRVLLGRVKGMQRMKRFVAFYPRLLAARVAEVGEVDLRYPNGMVLRWRMPQNAVTTVG